MVKSLIKRCLIVILIVTYIILGYCGAIYLISNRNITLDVCPYTKEQKQAVLDKLWSEKQTCKRDYTMTTLDWRILLADDLNLHCYIYAEEDLPGSTVGLADIYTRKITMDVEREDVGYIKTFVHEVLHIKLCTLNERYVTYETFKFLYNHTNSHVRLAGIVYAKDQLDGGYRNTKYDISELIMYYFLTEGDDEK